MKNTTRLLFIAALASLTTSCESFLDINENPNSITTDNLTPNFVLAQALKVTGDNVGNELNTYGSWVAGYWAQAGGVNGFSEERTYTYTALYRQAVWNNIYDNLEDYDVIERNGASAGFPYHAAIAKIMKAYNYQLLVDQYGDIPYSSSLQGATNVTPTYDKAEDVYKDLLVKLDQAIAEIKAVPASVPKAGAEDIVFQGNMTKWVQFANTLKLRLLLRQSFVPALEGYVRDEMTKLQQSATDGFITTDVAVQPGYLQTTGKQNPFWNRYRAVPAGTPSAERQYQAGTQYVIDQYANNNDARVSQLYIEAPNAPGTYKGLIPGDANPPAFPQLSRWKDYGGILKGYDAPVPLMLLAEGYFLQAEAKSRGFLTGGDAVAKTDFNNGIRASFIYYFTPAPSQLSTVNNNLAKAEPGYTAYLDKNKGNALIDWDAAGATKLEKIIYQKYLAMNSVTGAEAWNEYRRTGFPKFPASQQSTSTRADKLPVRLLYPQTEVTANSKNVPTGINQFTSKIFWDVLD